MDYQSNSNKSREPEDPKKPEKKVEKVITGEAIIKKKSLGRRFKDVFFGGDFSSAVRFVAADVLLPAARNIVVDAVTITIERVLYGESRAQQKRRPEYRSYVEYNNPYSPTRSRPYTHLPDQPRHYPPISSTRRASRRADDTQIVLTNRSEAEMVVETLINILEKYDVVSVADLHSLISDTDPNHNDYKWGWTSLSGIQIRQIRDGYLIDLPPAEPI